MINLKTKDRRRLKPIKLPHEYSYTSLALEICAYGLFIFAGAFVVLGVAV